MFVVKIKIKLKITEKKNLPSPYRETSVEENLKLF